MSEEQKMQVPARWNGFTSDYPRDRCIHELFEEIAHTKPFELALIFADIRLTYGELNARANQIAHYLRSLGVGPDVLVGICFERGIEMIVAMLAILKAGGAYVPLDPRYPPDRLAFLIADTALGTILSDHVSGTKLPARSAISSPRILIVDAEGPAWAHLPESNPETAAGPRNLAYIIYTSGSTGRPKGVMIEHRAVIRLLRDTDFVNFDRAHRFLQLAPISFDASIFEIWGALLNGVSLAIMPAGVPSLAAIVETINRHRVTTAFFTPALFNMLVDSHVNRLGSLKQIVIGGDVVSPGHFLRAIDHLPKCALINGYGPTESTVFAICYLASRESATRERIPIGFPIANTQAFILDGNLKPVSIDAVGELYLGGDGLARGYLNCPELTSEKFIAIAGIGERLYRTGDLARFRSDGAIEFLGRVDAQLKISGYRVEPGEIVFALRQYPEVRDAAVVCQDAADPGVGAERRLIAYVVGPRTLDPLELRDFLTLRLPYYMIPASFRVLEALPLTLNGKLDVARLPGPDNSGAMVENLASKQAGTNFEENIAALWGKALQRNEVGRDENFFDAGGDSLRLIALHSALSRTLSISLTIDDLFEHPTIASLARWLRGEQVVNPARESLRDRVRKQHESLRRRREAQAGS
jgi:amino acid adenylation domain-containing protein